MRVRGRILVIDDEVNAAAALETLLKEDGYDVASANDGPSGLLLLERHNPDVVLTDLRMPGMGGLELLAKIKELRPETMVILMTAYGTAESAVEAMKAGAADYVLKPFSMDELRLRVQRLAAQRSAEARSEKLLARLTPELIAESPAMKAALAAARQVAPTEASVLLTGESGTGKSQLARFIHYQGKRAARNRAAMGRMSSRRSRSGGTRMPNTSSR